MNWQKVKKDLFLAVSSQFFDKVVGYLVLMMLTRYLEKERVGELFFTATLAYFFVLLTELGMNQYLLREVAEKPERALQPFSEVLSLRLPLFGGYFLLVNGVVLVIRPELLTIMLFTSIYVLLEDFYQSFGVLFLGLKRVAYRVMAGVSAKFVLISLILITVAGGGTLHQIILCYILAYLVLVGLAFYLVWKKIGRFGVGWQREATFKILKSSFPFFLITFLSLVQFKVDTLMVGFLDSYEAVATYEAGFRLLEVSRFLIRPVGMIFFPLFAGMVVRQEWVDIQRLLRKIWLITGGVGGLLTGLVLLAAGYIIPFIYGPKYDDSISILRVLYLTVPALYLSFVNTFLANALHLERKVIGFILISVTTNVVLNSLAIPLWGPQGAAWTTVISEVILAVGLIKLNWGELLTQRSKASVIDRPTSSLQPVLSVDQ